MFKPALLLLVMLSLAGCGLTRSTSHEVTTIKGTVAGQPVDVVMDANGTSSTSLDTTTFWNIASTVLSSLGGGTGIMAMILAWRERTRANEHREDANNAGKTWMPVVPDGSGP